MGIFKRTKENNNLSGIIELFYGLVCGEIQTRPLSGFSYVHQKLMRDFFSALLSTDLWIILDIALQFWLVTFMALNRK